MDMKALQKTVDKIVLPEPMTLFNPFHYMAYFIR